MHNGRHIIHVISIHASAKEATFQRVPIKLNRFQFQSTLPRRKRLTASSYINLLFLLQSTLPRRKRRKAKTYTSKKTNCNPRFREGSDKLQLQFSRVNEISIHASAKEATTWMRKAKIIDEFQSTLPRRKRPYGTGQIVTVKGISIHASAKEATVLKQQAVLTGLISIHASAKEATICITTIIASIGNFNPRFREGSDAAGVLHGS